MNCMNKVYVDDIISIVKYIIKKDPYDLKHNENNWQFRKLTNDSLEIKRNIKALHVWRVESNADANCIIEGTLVSDKTSPEIDLKKVVLLILELC